MTPTHMFSFEYGRIFKNTFLEDYCEWLLLYQFDTFTPFKTFTPPKPILFPYNKQWKKPTLPNILAVSAAGMFMDRETNSQPCFQGFLYWWSPENEVEYLSIFIGKGLMEKFDYCKISSCFELVKPVHILLGTNVATALLLQKEIRVICTKNQVWSFPHNTF